MRKLAAIGLLLLVSVVIADDEFYDPKYDNFDVDSVIENLRLMKGYALCFLDKGNCTPDGKNFKKWIPDAIENNCAKCSPKQKVLIRKVMRAIKEKLPGEWEELLKKYDPETKYTEELKKFLEATD